MWYKDPQWISNIVALFLGLLGIFQDGIRSWFRGPAFKISLQLEPPDSHKIDMRDRSTGVFMYDAYYFRFRVLNNGNQAMEGVEAMVTELYKKEDSGIYKRVENFLPLNLVWSHYGGTTAEKIQPAFFKHLDFGHIIKTEFAHLDYYHFLNNYSIVFILDTAITPNTGSHYIFPGDYKIRVNFAANNLKPNNKIYHLFIADKWMDNEHEMLNRCLSIRETDSI